MYTPMSAYITSIHSVGVYCTMCRKGNGTRLLSLSVWGIAAQPAGGKDGRALGRLGATLQVRGMSTRKTAWGALA